MRGARRHRGRRAWLADFFASTRPRRVVHRAADVPEGGLDECGEAESAFIGSKKDAWKRERKGGSSG